MHYNEKGNDKALWDLEMEILWGVFEKGAVHPFKTSINQNDEWVKFDQIMYDKDHTSKTSEEWKTAILNCGVENIFLIDEESNKQTYGISNEKGEFIVDFKFSVQPQNGDKNGRRHLTTINAEYYNNKNNFDMAKKYTKSEIEGMIKNLKEKEKKARSKWGKAVLQDAQWLLENVIEGYDEPYELSEKLVLNGAENWNQFSWGGSALVYNGEIAEHYSTPSELKNFWGLTKDGGVKRDTNTAGEHLLDIQARALRQAWWAIRDEMNGTTEFSMSLCEFEEKKGESNFDMDNPLDEYFDLLVDNGIATENELRLVIDINGYTGKTLNDVLYARTGYRSWEQYCEANDIENEDDDDDDDDENFSIEETNVRSKGGSSSSKYFCVIHANSIESSEKVGDKTITRFWSFVPDGNFKSFVESENGTPKRSIEKNHLGSYDYKEEYPCGELQYWNGKLRFVLYKESEENVVIKKGDSLGFIKNRYVWRTIKEAFDNFNAKKIKKYTFKEVYDNLKNEGFKEIEYLSKEYSTHFSIIDDTKDVLRATGKLAGNIVKNTTDKGGLLMF